MELPLRCSSGLWEGTDQVAWTHGAGRPEFVYTAAHLPTRRRPHYPAASGRRGVVDGLLLLPRTLLNFATFYSAGDKESEHPEHRCPDVLDTAA